MSACRPRRAAIPGLLVLTLIAGCRTAAPDRPPLVQPGAPGAATRQISVAEATDLSKVQHTPADVRFMQGMIAHHAQAVEMTALVLARKTSPEVRLLAQRITASQEDEIAMMRRWLELRGQELPGPHAHHDPAHQMPGMLTADEMRALGAAEGPAFERLFLQGMIKHHEGAITMVQELFATPGAGQETEISAFASDVDIDQRMEIDRMRDLLGRP